VTTQNLTLPAVDWNGTSLVVVEGDLGFVEFGTTQSILRSVLDGFVQEVVSITQEETIRALPSDLKPTDWEDDQFVTSRIQSVPGTESFTPFDYIAPGILVFGLLIISGSVASALAREVERKNLERLQISTMRSFDLLFGTMIPWAVIAATQVVILLGVAIAIGFHWQGGLNGILAALLIGIISGISSVALGLIIAAFSKSESHANTLGPLIWVPLSFLIGAFFTVRAPVLVDVLPWGQAIEALRGVLTFGLSFNEVSMNVVWMTIQTIIVFAIGVLAFSRMRLKAQ
jgi:ABC-2 type transport system permease protein